jgi:hypothetical protein
VTSLIALSSSSDLLLTKIVCEIIVVFTYGCAFFVVVSSILELVLGGLLALLIITGSLPIVIAFIGLRFIFDKVGEVRERCRRR